MAYNNPTVQEFKDYYYRDFPFGTDMETSVIDADIAKAYGQTNFNFNPDLFADQNSYTIGYLLMAAHYLVVDLRMAAQGISGQYSWVVNSKSVGSVSESFSIPQRILDNPEYAMYSQTNYGAKFLQLILPQLSGQIFSVFGGTRA